MTWSLLSATLTTVASVKHEMPFHTNAIAIVDIATRAQLQLLFCRPSVITKAETAGIDASWDVGLHPSSLPQKHAIEKLGPARVRLGPSCKFFFLEQLWSFKEVVRNEFRRSRKEIIRNYDAA